MHLYGREVVPSRDWDTSKRSSDGGITLAQRSTLEKRAPSKDAALLAVVGVLAATIIIFAIFCSRRRYKRRQDPKAHTSAGRGSLDRFIAWFRPGKGQYQNAGGGDDPHSSSRRNGANNAGANGTVDRHTSVRSVMTLPPYHQMATINERVLGREGERDGVDVVVDLPTADQDEAMRDQEMETLYQIRETRRQQIAERDERHRLRQEARRNNDSAAMAEVQARARAASNDPRVNELRAEMERIKESRQRSVSTVSYGDLGVARHDGTRIRANSNESERMGLLSDAASIALSARSGAVSPGLSHRQRGDSTASMLTTDSARLSMSPDRSRSSPDAEDEADLGQGTVPPPEYEDVSLDDDNDSGREQRYTSSRPSTLPSEPPPDYPGPHGPSDSSETLSRPRSVANGGPGVVDADHEESDLTSGSMSATLAGDLASLPSLSVEGLPAIVVNSPTSARPRDED